MVEIKRAYDAPSRDDGYRVLIDRLWPRGIKKTDLKIDEWTKVLAPSAELRRAFGHDPKRWAMFQARYKSELRSSEAKEKIRALVERAKNGKVTLIYSAKDVEHNNAVVLKRVLSRKLRTPAKTSKGKLS